jgi:hypothetical protein
MLNRRELLVARDAVARDPGLALPVNGHGARLRQLSGAGPVRARHAAIARPGGTDPGFPGGVARHRPLLRNGSDGQKTPGDGRFHPNAVGQQEFATLVDECSRTPSRASSENRHNRCQRATGHRYRRVSWDQRRLLL